MNRMQLFNNDWEFAVTPPGTEEWHGLSFRPVEIPHDWLIGDSTRLYEDSTGWYRKILVWEGRATHASLYFEGVYMDSTLYVNGREAGNWKYGYSSFEHEITPFLREGENELVVKVVHRAPNSRWYSGAGIYRNVWLILRGASYIPTHGVYVTVRKGEETWSVEIETELHLTQEAVLEHTLWYRRRPVSSCRKMVSRDTSLDASSLEVRDPLLWSPEAPHLYTLLTLLYDGEGTIIEEIPTPVGFRHLAFHPHRGLLVNGMPTKLHGTCEHHDLGALGAVFNRAAMRHRLSLLKSMGVNALRTAHNMPAPDLMHLADEMGFFVVSEAFDMWERPKTRYDYARFFPEWYERDVASWVRRDRNHPSLLMWSIGNEIYDTHVSERGVELTRLLAAEVRKHDPKGNAPVTMGSNYMPWEGAQRCADILKVIGYNYGEAYYHEHHEAHPDWVIYGSETASVVQSRGVYHFPFDCTILAEEDEQCSALGNSSTSWGAPSHEACIAADRDAPFSLGHFIWSGFDYLGEPTPYHTKNSYFGQIDTAGFPKDSFYIYKAAWTDYRRDPFVHIFPYWDWNPGQLIDVRVCSNAPRIALYLNGRLIGIKDIDHQHGTEQTGWWKIPYEPGELVALAYDDEGRCVARAVRRSFGDPARLRLTPSREFIEADGRDVVFVTIEILDAEGNPVENASNRVRVEVRGAGRLLGLDNGDSTDYDSYHATSRRLFNGKLMALIGATRETGPVEMVVHSKDLPPARLILTAVPSERTDLDCISVIHRAEEKPCRTGREDEIPVRKIELTVIEGTRMLTPDSPSVRIEARLLPENTSYREVEWKAVTPNGIETPLALVRPEGLEAVVTARGDGSFFVRCTSRNGTDTVRLISQLECTAEGFGRLHKDPYSFISAGLYDDSNGKVTPGNEKGIATARDGITIVGFTDLDFGPDGSDTITIPIFALSADPYRLQIWRGHPEAPESELLADVIYRKDPVWNVYQEARYRLRRRLRGVQSLYFLTEAKMHMKGFVFERQVRAYSTIHAHEYDVIYGDDCEITSQGVERIGNNVTLTFENLDFGDEPPKNLTIYGRSRTDNNSIQIRFEQEDRRIVHLIEFPYSVDSVERTYPLPPLPAGRMDVSFVFLPGSSFDLGWFRFGRDPGP
ncbi:glycoside hydrolase family 2 sugar binding protein [Spirochaeta thermophila DSM 6578]|uniref:Glycoside hydrolase family 2 sugar binding protein n=1 Tax=Winmispira thermophila (strain ATCC 700085 / DSM 6578 / Z-1203) TaxID=869211 RepID=G0GDR3_WINT7|nr:glycoside hydrolase family 2 TIM barrel-domain containing protein [Spirochaeta thermophila]AEJ62193.1 glycoside hydrolase family 2 sugar binding protein [Spirochaeta thermophila DSM 6578]